MSIRSPWPVRVPIRHRGMAVALGLLVLATLTPSGVSVAHSAPPAHSAHSAPPAHSAPDGGLRPTIHYDEAVAHAHDRIAFAPGDRVTVPFRPRVGDRWTVDGMTPRALPAGVRSGRAMRSVLPPEMVPIKPPAPRSLPDDRPIVDPRSVIHATDLSWDASTTPTYDLAAAVDPGALRREVFGFLPYWELSDRSTRLDWDKISTVAYFGVGVDGAGNLMKRNTDGSTTIGWSGWTSDRMTNVINAAHRSHARVVLTVQSFAWSSTGLKRQKAMLGSATARAHLARQIAAAVRDRGADGVNLDIEPIASGYSDEFTALVRKVRSALDAVAPGYQLTFDTTGWIGNYPIADATKRGGADAVFIMGYDYRSSGSSPVGSIAPLAGPGYDLTDTVRAFLDRVPASKLILGVPYYGRAWSTSTDKLHAKNISGTRHGPSTSVVYATARDLASTRTKHYDPTEGVTWIAYKRETCTKTYGCETAWRQLYYDDAKALRAKYDLVNRYDLRGIGIWALGYDGTRPELYQAIKDKFITDTVPPVIGSTSLTSRAISPDGDGRLDTTTASLKATGLVRWGYKVQRMAGTKAGSVIRSGGKVGRTPAFTWDGRDKDGHRVKDGTYRITIWAADISNNRADHRFAVVVDTKRPKVTSAAGPGFFSPDADHHNDTIGLSWTAGERITGTASIRDRKGTAVRRWTFSALSTWAMTWGGANDAGKIVPDGRYVLRVDGRDPAGNHVVVDRPVLVDRTIRSVRWSHASFDPRAHATTRATIDLRRKAQLTVAIYRDAHRIRAIWTGRSQASGIHGWTWDGRTDAGGYAKPGRYRIVVLATSKYGTTRYSKTVTVESH